MKPGKIRGRSNRVGTMMTAFSIAWPSAPTPSLSHLTGIVTADRVAGHSEPSHLRRAYKGFTGGGYPNLNISQLCGTDPDSNATNTKAEGDDRTGSGEEKYPVLTLTGFVPLPAPGGVGCTPR